MTMIEYIVIFSVLQCVTANVLRNPGFESPFLTGAWTGYGGSIELVKDDVYRGQQALKAFNRKSTGNGAAQRVDLKPGGHYRFKAHVKQLNDNKRTLFQAYNAAVQIPLLDNSDTLNLSAVSHPYVQKGTGWFVLEGDVLLPTKDFKTTLVHIGGPDAGIDFLVDDVSFEEIWKIGTIALTEKVRQNKMNFIVTTEPNLNQADMTIKIDLKQHDFGFGCRVQQQWITDPSYKEYQDFFYYLFNWGTLQNFEWQSPLNVTYNSSKTKEVAEELIKHGLKVHAESLFRQMDGKIPSWLQQLDATTFNQTVQRRIKKLTNLMQGLVDQWDVIENILGNQIFEEKTRDPNYLEKIYKTMHEAVPSVELLLTEDDILFHGYDISVFEEIAHKLKAFGLGGIGVRARFVSSNLDESILKARLDRLGDAGLPIWITEFSVSEDNEDVRADMLEKALRIFFSHPAVAGVTLSAFWDHANAPNTALFEGFTFQVNAAGSRYLDLVKGEWSTHVSKNLSSETSFTVNGFHGDYDVTVLYKNNPIIRKNVHLGKTDMVYEMHVTGNGDKITLPTTTNPFVYLKHNYHTSRTVGYRIGDANSTATNPDLVCETRWSNVSAVGDDKTTQISCDGDEVMTGCSSVKENLNGSGLWYHDGEIFKNQNGTIFCRAINGQLSKEGVYAVARCCRARQLSCQYRISEASEPFWNSAIMLFCPANFIATGCLQHEWDAGLHGAIPSINGGGCVAKTGGTKYGVETSAACCSAPGLTFTRVQSANSGPQQGHVASVSCDYQNGYVMTGCNFLAIDGKSSGAYITGSDKMEKCIAVNGKTRSPGEQGVLAIASCCKINQQVPIIG